MCTEIKQEKASADRKLKQMQGQEEAWGLEELHAAQGTRTKPDRGPLEQPEAPRAQ